MDVKAVLSIACSSQQTYFNYTPSCIYIFCLLVPIKNHPGSLTILLSQHFTSNSIIAYLIQQYY